MRVLITGGAGFIGSHLADRLLAQGSEVLVLDNFSTGRRDNLAEHPRLTVVGGNIADGTLVPKVFDDFRPEVVVHAAASYKDPAAWGEDIRTNVLGTAHVAQAAREVGVRRLIYFQTALCYGLRPREQPVTLRHPLRAEGSSYAISKTAAEQYLEISGLDYVTFRLANIYGPRNLTGPLPTFYQRLTQGQRCYVADTRRDFVYIGDLIEVVAQACAGKGGNRPYHISSGRDYAIRELFDEVAQALGLGGAEVEVRPRNEDDAATLLLDPTETNRDFHWQPRVELAAGVRNAVAYYRQFGVRETYTHLKIARA
jgi:UDP-glucose 4-epimerase